MTNIDIEQVILLGGEAAVSSAVADAITAAGDGIDVIRLAGANRYETSVAVNSWAFAETFPGTPEVVAAPLPYDFGLESIANTNVFMARGDNFADALAGAPIVSQRNAMLVLTAQDTLSPATGAFLAEPTRVNPFFNQVTALGLGAAISNSVLAEANAAVN